MPKARPVKTDEREEASKGSPLETAFELLEALPVPVFVKSRDGRYLSVNRAWEELFGIPRSRFLGKRVKDLYPQSPAIAGKHHAMDELLWANPGGQSYEIPITTPDGRVRDTVYFKSTFPSRGAPEGLIGAIFDITGRKVAEAALRESEERFRHSFELAGSGLAHIGLDRRFLRVNSRLCEILGYSEKELLGLTGREISHPDDLDIINAERPRLYAGEIDSVRLEKRYLRKDGSTVWVAFTMVVERDAAGQPFYEIAVFDDITTRKQAEMALRESEERFRAVVDSANDGILVYDRQLNIIAANRAAERIIGLPLGKVVGAPGFTSLLACVKQDGSPLAPEDRPTRITIRTGEPQSNVVIGIRRSGEAVTWLSVNTAFLRRADETGWYGIVSTIGDITAQRLAESALRESEERFRQTFELAASGICHVIDGRFVRVNKSLSEILGYSEKELLGLDVKQISHPEDRDVTDADRARIRSGEIESARFEKRYIRADDRVVWVDLAVALVRDASRAPQYEIAIFDDITARKQAEAALREAHEELKRSNSELEQFAYVASHDLQEPLRMVSSYTQLLMRRYGDKFDKDAKEFMHYVVDGAARMKQLIEDLLAYSRVGTRAKNFGSADMEAALRRAITNLRVAIEEAGAAVTWDSLPTVRADDAQLTQLFQNLIGNALKFRSASVPRIHVSASQLEDEWQLTVRDNGIGIERQYFERIFMVFQRLHNKAEYPGTGIGLAICKKVVERHGGRIWVESQPGEGSAFHFTLPRQGEDAHD